MGLNCQENVVGGAHSFLLAGWIRGLHVHLRAMVHMRDIGAWLCLLLWGGVHALQLGHAVFHHVAVAGHGDHCEHHHAQPESLPWDLETPVVKVSQDCPLCDWTGVPAMPGPVFAGLSHIPAISIPKVMGMVCSGWRASALQKGIGWRGPPGADFV